MYKVKIFLFLIIFYSYSIYAKSEIIKIKSYKISNITYIDVKSNIEIPKKLIEAIKEGLTLSFNYEFIIKDEKYYKPIKLLNKNLTYLVSFNKLTNEFILNNPIKSQVTNYKNLRSLIKNLEEIKGFPLMGNHLFKNKKIGKVRFNLNITKLPIYTQIKILFFPSWEIKSKWKIWKIK